MIEIRRTDAKNQDFKQLVELLDADLAIRDGDDHTFYHQFNKIDTLQHCVVLYENELAVACGAFKEFDAISTEIKRMYVAESYRGKGYATMVLKALEKWTLELYYKKCVLETGKKQFEAIGLYQKNDYKTILNYGQYADKENSVCFEKLLI